MTHADAISVALAEMRDCQPQDPADPLVGAALAKGSDIVARGHRGKGAHAEFGLLRNENPFGLPDELVGWILYTTLEPCTFRGVDENNNPKESCAELILRRRISRVVIGMLDPNPYILGNGVVSLREHGVEVLFFPPDAMRQVEEANVAFRSLYGLGDQAPMAQHDYRGHWIAETTFETGAHTTENVFLQNRIGNRFYGVMLSLDRRTKYDFVMTHISGNVWDYSFRSKSRTNQLDHGAGVIVFDSPVSARGTGATHGAFAPSQSAPIVARVAMRRA